MNAAECLRYEQTAYDEGYRLIGGTDEAGRGPLAGDVYAAAVILPQGLLIEGLDDSKKLTHKRRVALQQTIERQAIAYAVASATVEEIDTLNIRNAAMLAMQRAVAALSPSPDFLLVDGNYAAGFVQPYLTIVKGDANSLTIAAASILAKVARDESLLHLHEQYPMYGFDKHKGYGTSAHYAALAEFGPSPVHRRSFRLL